SANAKSSVVSNDSSHEKSSPPYPDQAPSNRSPQQLDKHRSIERFHRTLADEWAYARLYRSDVERCAAFTTWLHTYNHHRGHTALAGHPPAGRVTNLSGQYN
ncbi:integrase core domain-containing protein, partial [Nocardia sp. CWNU-33]|uniref:integrase core domain-containing protein n=1 Tax=Nocardia sp. CWNU-33 TaxID=3392117 RepID=UPI00398F385A